MARKDNRGRNLRTGESQRKDGLYMYRYKDERTGRRLAVYSPDLAELRKKEKEIEKDQSEGIMTDTQCKNMTLNGYQKAGGEYTGQLQKDVEQSCEE